MSLASAIDMIYTADVFLHRWDLARATGQDETLDADRCAEMLAGMLPMAEVLRQSGQYGPRVEVPHDADVTTNLHPFIGPHPCPIPAATRLGSPRRRGDRGRRGRPP